MGTHVVVRKARQMVHAEVEQRISGEEWQPAAERAARRLLRLSKNWALRLDRDCGDGIYRGCLMRDGERSEDVVVYVGRA